MNVWTKTAVPVLAVAAALLTACGTKEETPVADTTKAAATAAPALTLAQIAGDFEWTMKAENSDSVLMKGHSHQDSTGRGYSISDANPKDTAWYNTTLKGDSIMEQSEPFTNMDPKSKEKLTFKFWGTGDANSGSGMVTIQLASKPDSIVGKGRVESKRKM